MSNANFARIYENPSGIFFFYNKGRVGYHPLHWHEELELLYSLRGNSIIQIDKHEYFLNPRQLIVIEPRRVHSIHIESDNSACFCVQISKKRMKQYLPEIESYKINCTPDKINNDKTEHYREICGLIEKMILLHMEKAPGFLLEIDGLIMQLLARLIRYFSEKKSSESEENNLPDVNRIHQIIAYVETHFREPLTLKDACAQIGIGKEYFCRIFKRNMGISFLRYLSEVRLAHIYADLVTTNLSVEEIAERNGFINQKLFNRDFKALYGRTPSTVRKTADLTKI